MDEAFSWRIAQFGWSDIVLRTSDDVHPPFYYLLLKGWISWFGDSATSIRALSGLFGLGIVAGVYLLALEMHTGSDLGCGDDRRGRAREVGLLSAGFAAFGASNIVHSREARMYAMGGLLAVLSSWALLRGLRDERAMAPWLAYAILATGLAYTHNYGLFTIVSQALLLGILLASKASIGDGEGGRIRRLWMRATFAFGLVGLAYAPWIAHLLMQRERVVGEYWTQPLNASTMAGAIEQAFTGNIEANTPTAGAVAPLLAGAVLLLLLARRRGADLGLVCLISVPFLLGVGISAAQGRNILIGRCLFFSDPFLLTAVASLVLAGEMHVVARRVLAGLLLLAMACQAFWSHLAEDVDRKPGLNSAAAIAMAEFRAGDMLLACDPGDYLALRHLTRGRDVPVYVFSEKGRKGLTWGIAVISDDDCLGRSKLEGAEPRRLWLFRNDHATLIYATLSERWTLRRAWSFDDVAPYRGHAYLDLLEVGDRGAD